MVYPIIANILSRYKYSLFWFHILFIVIFITLLPYGAFIIWEVPLYSILGMFILLIWLIGYCQNIGLLHEFCHREPFGPKYLSRFMVHLLFSFGGLSYNKVKFAHLKHHEYLGTDLDPDRLGYLTTDTFWKRFRYLFLIGPLRSKYAPVDVQRFYSDTDDYKRKILFRKYKIEYIFMVMGQILLILLLGKFYLISLFMLIMANILSNIREIAEHGFDINNNNLIVVKPNIFEALLFSNPGFWYHGIHHWRMGIHYLDLPAQYIRKKKRINKIITTRKGYFNYLFSGNSVDINP